MLNQRIKERRKCLKLTQKELGDKIGASEFTVSKYERGVNEPDMETLKKLSDVLECSSDYLLGKADSPITQIIEYNDKELGKIEIGMDNYPHQLSPEDVEEMIKTLKEWHFNVDALIDDIKNRKNKDTK